MREIKNKENNWEEFKEARNQYINIEEQKKKLLINVYMENLIQ